MPDCRHRCCEIRTNRCHTHLNPPESCRACELAAPGSDGDERAADIAGVVRSVMRVMGPEMPGLTEDVVVVEALDACGIAAADPELSTIPPDEWRCVVATRVALSLAFPHG